MKAKQFSVNGIVLTKQQIKELKDRGITDPVARLFSLMEFEDYVESNHYDVFEEAWEFLEYSEDKSDE